MANTWRCMQSSWWILKQDKELLLFPVFSGIAAALILVSFLLPLLNPDTQAYLQRPDTDDRIILLLLFLFYFANYFVLIFFNSAIVACAIKRTRGGDPTVTYGLQAAWSRLPQILGWALLTSTVGFILRLIEERFELVGRIIIAMLGMAWTVTSYLVVPVLVVEGKGPVDAYSESVSLLKRSWGEQLIGNLGFGLIFMLLGILPVGLLMLAAMTGSGLAVMTVIAVSAVYLVILSLIQSTLQAIFQAAVYCYAVDGQAPAGFDEQALAGAFRRR